MNYVVTIYLLTLILIKVMIVKEEEKYIVVFVIFI